MIYRLLKYYFSNTIGKQKHAYWVEFVVTLIIIIILLYESSERFDTQR